MAEEDTTIDMESFSEAVLLSKKCGRYKGMDFVDIITGLCEDYKIEIETVPDLISPKIRRLMTQEEALKHTIEVKPNANTLW